MEFPFETAHPFCAVPLELGGRHGLRPTLQLIPDTTKAKTFGSCGDPPQ